MNITVLGAGYVGCVTGACLAKMGHAVTVIDITQSKIDALKSGHSPVLEPGLDELVADGVDSGQLHAELVSDDATIDLLRTDAALLCIATPSQPNGVIDSRALRRAFQEIARGAQERRSPLTVIVRSTALAPLLRQILAETEPRHGAEQIRLVVNPELLRETTAINDFFHPPLIVAGGDDPSAVDLALSLYEGIPGPRHRVSLETACMFKYACNAFHALKITFANEMDTLATLAGASGLEVMKLLVQDNVLNISPAYLRPGFSFGGSCLPKDLRALESLARKNDQPLPVLSAVLLSNRLRLEQALRAILARPARNLGIIGLTFKKGSDDLRESPYVEIAEHLFGKGFTLKIYDSDLDPTRLVGANMAHVMERLPHLARMLVNSAEEACANVEAVILCKPLVPLESLKSILPKHVLIYHLERMSTIMGSQEIRFE